MCASCGQPGGPDDRFCARCGTALTRSCGNCGHTAAPEAAFCTRCGQSLTDTLPGPPPAPPGLQRRHEDRRRVSVLFIDVVSFTRFAERSDPEQVRIMQTSFFNTVQRVIRRYGGLVEKYIGDAVMALFGAPVTTETEVLGCVSAALELQRTLRRKERGDELSFGFRIGVATGEALVDTAAARDGGQAIAAGDVINTAARLQSAAPPGGVLVDGPTHAATSDYFRYERRDPVTLRGHSVPTELWIPVTPVRRRIADRDLDDTPLVNRTHELSLLVGVLDRIVTDRLPQLVTLFGRAGIGKSRLVLELFRHATSRSEVGIRWRTGHCPPFGENVTYAAFADIVKAEAGLLDSDDTATAQARLHEAVARLVPPAEAERLANALGPLVGLPGQQLLAEDTESAWRRFVVALASERPTVLVVEDLHWADQTMVSFVERLGSVVREVPLLVLCTSRPELLDREPAWAAAIPGSQTISLSSMNDKHISAVYTSLFGKATFPVDILERLVELAGGNPLYAHEYFRMLLEQGTLHAPGEATVGATAEHPIPDNVHAVIANRIDLIDPDDRSVLHAASVLGVVFWADAVANILDLPVAAVERTLRRMEQRDLVREQAETSREGQTEYRFSHVLVRDVCYQRLPRTERVAQHSRVADWLQTQAADTDSPSNDLAEVVANHRFWAHEIARTLQLDTRPYAGPARRALHRAARRTYALHALDVAAEHVARALRLFASDETDTTERHELGLLEAELSFLRDGDAFVSGGGIDRLATLTETLEARGDAEMAARAWAMRGKVAWVTADRDVAADNLTRAVTSFAALPDSEPKATAHADLARLYLSSSELPQAIRAARTAAEIAGRLGLVEVKANAMTTIGACRYLSGESEGLHTMREVLQTCRRLKLPSLRRVCQNLGSALQEEGELDSAEALLGESERVNVSDGHSIAINYTASAHRAFLAGDWNGTLVANEALRDTPSGAWDLQSRLQSVWLRALRGEATPTDADEVAEVLQSGRNSGFPRLEWTALGHGAFCLALHGRTEEAADLMQDLVDSWLPVASLPSGEWTAAAGHAAATLGGRAARALHDMLDRSPRHTPWVRAARCSAAGALLTAKRRAGVAGDLHSEAAALYRRIGTRSDEILALSAAARGYAADGRFDRAEACLREVRTFAAQNHAERLLPR